jgi:hypothetical protein
MGNFGFLAALILVIIALSLANEVEGDIASQDWTPRKEAEYSGKKMRTPLILLLILIAFILTIADVFF